LKGRSIESASESQVFDDEKNKIIKYFGMEEGKAMTSRERAFSRM
jgi:hypothetical protein